jgi:glycosyltransferase involved in cell wall biosynthesis
LRVLQIFSVLSMGGAETWLMSLLRYFRQAENDSPLKVTFDVLLTGGEKDIFDDEAIALGARLFYVPFTRRNTFAFLRRFRQILADGNYDAIHDHQDYVAGLHFLMGLGKLPAIRIGHVHNPLYNRTNVSRSRRLVYFASKQLLRWSATHIRGTSRQVIKDHGLDSEQLPKIDSAAAHCGFEVSEFAGDGKTAHADLCHELGWDPAAKVILFIGRLEADEVFHLGRIMTHKNPAFALELVRECIAKDQNVRLVMVGDGATKRREFEQQVKEWGLVGKIRFLGVRHDVARLMLGADLLLFPSLAEGLGMVVVEAQAAGLRILASDTTPRECVVVPELVKFLPLIDTGRWADEALRLLHLEPTDRARCNALVSSSEFSIQNSARTLLRIYCPSPVPETR